MCVDPRGTLESLVEDISSAERAGQGQNGVHVTVRVSSTLPIPAELAGSLMGKPALLQHVTWPLLRIRGLPDRVVPGQRMTVHLTLLGVLPLWEHTIEVISATATEARTEESGGPLRSWRHHLIVKPLSPTSCLYTDEVDIDAGRHTRLARAVATGFYRYRHRRWLNLARVLA